MPVCDLARAGASALFLSVALAPPATSQGDNILVILADDLGVDNVGAYQEGANPPPTPNLDALAARGVLFRNVWSNPTCSPTRAGIMTGRHAFRTGVGYAITAGCPQCGTLDQDEVTIPEMLDRAGSGYAHGFLGKWHLSALSNRNAPNQHGWSHFAGMLAGQLADYFNWGRTVNGNWSMSTTYATTQQVDDAVAWIHLQSRPWLCFLSFNAPHRPYHKPPQSLHTQNLADTTDPVKMYRAMVEAMDTEIGRLLTALGPALPRTNVIFLGDNGTPAKVSLPPFDPAHAKATPYEGGAGVPLIVAGPAVRAPGREESAVVATVDLYATIADLAGVNARTQVPPWLTLDSVSFAPYLGDPAQPPLRTDVFTEQYVGQHFAHAMLSGEAAVRNDRFKLIRFYLPARDELYDLESDPFEQSELLAQSPLTSLQSQNLAVLGQALLALRTPASGLFHHGAAGCVGSNGTPTAEASGQASLGHSYQISLHDAAASRPAFLTLGGSYTTTANIPLPFDLATIGGGAGCIVFGSLDAITPTATDATGTARVTVRVPNRLELVERTVHHGWLVLDALAPGNPLGLVTSDAIAARVGF